jgi:hypothetical protein
VNAGFTPQGTGSAKSQGLDIVIILRKRLSFLYWIMYLEFKQTNNSLVKTNLTAKMQKAPEINLRLKH